MTIEKEIELYVVEKYKNSFTDRNLKLMSIQSRMQLVNMKDDKKWNEFKLKLREAGYII